MSASNCSKPEVSCLTLMGTGTIGGCVLQMIPDFMNLKEIHIIDRRPDVQQQVKELCDTSVFAEDIKKIDVHCHNWTLTEENYEELLGPLFEKSEAVMDLTTVLSTVAMSTLADKHGCVYMNACIELFTKCFMSIQERHNIARNLKLKKTCVFEHGMNPGVVSHILRVALKDANLSPEDIDLVHITEYDDHILKPEARDPEAFYNTWSPFGLYEEAIERAELAWPVKQNFPLSEATKTDQMVVFNELSGYDVYLNSVTPLIQDNGTFDGFKKYQGYVVTHGETETISKELGNNVVCAFVFRTAPVATECLAKWKKEEAPKYVMMEGRNIEKGGDTIGVLLRSSSKKKAWWMGSACTAEIATKQVSPIQNGATITVASGCLVAIVWALANPDRGVVFPEDMEDSVQAWDDCKKYMGHVASMEVPWELVADMDINPVIGKPQDDRWTVVA